MTEIYLNPGLHVLAFSQAKSMTRQNNSFLASITGEPTASDILCYSVTAGISLELYFKALMIAARNGRVTKGHDLSVLYQEFPEYITRPIEHYYDERVPSFGPLTCVGLIQAKTLPRKPNRLKPKGNYGTASMAIKSLSKTFVESRYFFEKIDEQDYSYIDFAKEPVEALSYSLSRVYGHFVDGDFTKSVPA